MLPFPSLKLEDFLKEIQNLTFCEIHFNRKYDEVEVMFFENIFLTLRPVVSCAALPPHRLSDKLQVFASPGKPPKICIFWDFERKREHKGKKVKVKSARKAVKILVTPRKPPEIWRDTTRESLLTSNEGLVRVLSTFAFCTLTLL